MNLSRIHCHQWLVNTLIAYRTSNTLTKTTCIVIDITNTTLSSTQCHAAAYKYNIIYEQHAIFYIANRGWLIYIIKCVFKHHNDDNTNNN